MRTMLTTTLDTDPEYQAWENRLRSRVKAARTTAGVSLQACERAGVAETTVIAIESGRSRNIFLDQVHTIAAVCGTTVLALVDEDDSTPDAKLAVMEARVRKHLHAARAKAEVGNDRINSATGMKPATRATTRMESGQLARLDLLRLWRIARALNTKLEHWL